MVTWVAGLCGLDPLDAYHLVTQAAVESPLANVCDTNYTSVAKMAKRYLGSNTLSNGPTDFKSSSPQAFLAKFSLVERNITTWDQVRGEISAGRPVIILVNNNAYRYLTPPPCNWYAVSIARA